MDRSSKIIESYAVTTANVHDSKPLDELTQKGDGELHADSAYCSEEINRKLATKQITPQINQRGVRYKSLSEQDRQDNREKSRVRARVEHVFGFMSNTMKSMELRCIGLKRAKTFVGLMNLVYNFCRFEQIVRLNIKIA